MMDPETRTNLDNLKIAINNKYLEAEQLMLKTENADQLKSLNQEISEIFNEIIAKLEIIPESLRLAIKDYPSIADWKLEKTEFDNCLVEWFEKLKPRPSEPSDDAIGQQASCSGDSWDKEPEPLSSSANNEWANAQAEFTVNIFPQVALTNSNEQQLDSRYEQNFVAICVLGQGKFGVVMESRNKKDQSYFAVKRIEIPNKPEERERPMREVRALERLKNKNIVKYFDHWTETSKQPPQGWQEKVEEFEDISSSQSGGSNSTSSSIDIEKLINQLEHGFDLSFSENIEHTYLYIQMELCQKESLKTWLENNRSRDFVKYLGIFHQVMSAVEYLHARNFIHRDLKPSNIMFSLHGDIKLGDFGLVTETDNEMIADISTNSKTNKGRHTKGVGTKSYMAPEQMSGGNYGKEVDIFALGLILFQLLSPFFTFSEKVYEMGKARELKFGEDFPRCRNELDVAKQMISFEPSLRPSAQEVKRSISRLRDNVISTRKMIRISEKYIESEMKLAMEFEIFLEKLSQNPDITLF